MSAIQTSRLPLYRRALRQPDKVRKVFHLLATQGLARTLQDVRAKLNRTQPIGYSAAGRVLAAGEGLTGLQIGDRVACAGAQCAHHAAVIRVPRNLLTRVPASVDLEAASTVALGAIALQGVRRAQPTLGETFVVIGLGIVGQLVAQLLRANGCRVIGADLDVQRLELAASVGMQAALDPKSCSEIEQVLQLTDGLGADGVIIAAATPSNSVVSSAFKMCRKKGRVVLVGDVGLQLNRADFYSKEIDFLISTSYGPGRYDERYEEAGVDYPPAYVRWTENRNMAEYLRLVAEGRVQLKPLIAAAFPIDEAAKAYDRLRSGSPRPLIVLLAYPQAESGEPDRRRIVNPPIGRRKSGAVRMAVVGTGAFTRGVHLPNLKRLGASFHLQAIVSRAGHNAVAAAREFGASYATTDYAEILADAEVDAVLLATRHHLHAQLTLQALKAGKHVLVEKPLCLMAEELEEIRAFFAAENEKRPMLLTGFNRRFSPGLCRVRELTRDRRNPMILNYRMNAGYLPADHWVFSAEGGGRNLGEACHIYDALTFLTDSPVTQIEAQAVRATNGFYQSADNFVATLAFADGSVGNVIYTSMGAGDYPKEHLEIFVDGKVLVLQDYRQLTVVGCKAKGWQSRTSEKGHREELIAFADAVGQGADWPSPLWQQVQATQIALEVDRRLQEPCRERRSAVAA
jgi:predicted dehydrogenase